MKKKSRKIHRYASFSKNPRDIDRIKKALARLKGSVISYKDPTEPVGLKDWEALK